MILVVGAFFLGVFVGLFVASLMQAAREWGEYDG